MPYRYIPNGFATKMFNLAAPAFTGDGMTGVLEEAIGKANYDRYMIAQDPLCGGRTEGNIDIILNPGETSPDRMRFACIGVIQSIEQPSKPLRLRYK